MSVPPEVPYEDPFALPPPKEPLRYQVDYRSRKIRYGLVVLLGLVITVAGFVGASAASSLPGHRQASGVVVTATAEGDGVVELYCTVTVRYQDGTTIRTATVAHQTGSTCSDTPGQAVTVLERPGTTTGVALVSSDDTGLAELGIVLGLIVFGFGVYRYATRANSPRN